jgi:hypothetical protein
MRALTIALLASLTAVSHAGSDDPEADVGTAVQRVDGPSGSAVGAANGAKASVQASSDTSGAAAQLSHIWAMSDHGAFTGNLMAAAPFSGTTAPKPEVGSVSMLTAGVNTRVDAGWVFFPRVRPEEEQALITKKDNEICDSFVASALGRPYYYNSTEATRKTDPIGKVCHRADGRRPRVRFVDARLGVRRLRQRHE